VDQEVASFHGEKRRGGWIFRIVDRGLGWGKEIFKMTLQLIR